MAHATHMHGGVVHFAVIYASCMHAWLTVQILWQMHGRTLQIVYRHIVCM